ncbi:MAG TPA: polymer-forming cytoskeletal protein [Patescibacteria group bacterium]|nr:polymer-forming cytoskeletal protein [Patescibacteria group bacterium]
MAKNESLETIIAQGMRVEGELKSSGTVRLDGTVSGRVQAAQNIHVGPAAQVEADLMAQSAYIAGVVKGNVTVKNSLEIFETGKVLGNITCTRIVIHEGGYFVGNCQMREPKNEAQKLEGSNV